jgi:threonine dehydrogenase-like Zn-dependent dehydrogenase
MGIVGQLIVQLAKRSGAGAVIAVDMLENRLEKARESGADVVLNPKEAGDIALKVRALTANRGADVVFEASTSTQALHEAIRTVYPSGTVYATSFYRGEARGLFLGDEFHHLNARIVSSGCIPNDVRPRWNEQRWQEALQSTLPHLKLKHLISHEMSLTEAQQAYDLIDKHPHDVMQVIFSYQ